MRLEVVVLASLLAGCTTTGSKWLRKADVNQMISPPLEDAKRRNCRQEWTSGCLGPTFGTAPTNGVTDLTCEEFLSALKVAEQVTVATSQPPADFAGMSELLARTSEDVASFTASVWDSAISLDAKMSVRFPYGTDANGFRHSWQLAVARVHGVLRAHGASKALEDLDAKVIQAASADGR